MAVTPSTVTVDVATCTLRLAPWCSSAVRVVERVAERADGVRGLVGESATEDASGESGMLEAVPTVPKNVSGGPSKARDLRTRDPKSTMTSIAGDGGGSGGGGGGVGGAYDTVMTRSLHDVRVVFAALVTV